jgi:D-3-phosphoglycerate dehydrogenase
VKAATERGIVVIAPLEANAISVAELALGLMLALARKIPLSDRSTKAGGWDRRGGTGVELSNKTLAIVGFGCIGRLVSARARAFQMHVAAYDPYLTAEQAAISDSEVKFHAKLDQALAVADFVTVHLPLTPETRHLFNAKLFAAIKPGAHFINTSRGGVVDEAALLEALKSGHLGGCAMDVGRAPDQMPSLPLASRHDVIATPHIAGLTMPAIEHQSLETVAQAGEIVKGRAPKGAVNAEHWKRKP